MACWALYWGPVPSLNSLLTVWVLNCVPDGEFSQCLNLTFSLVVHCVRSSIIQTWPIWTCVEVDSIASRTSEYCSTLRSATMEGYLSSHFFSFYSHSAEARTSKIVWRCYCTSYSPPGLNSVCVSGEEGIQCTAGHKTVAAESTKTRKLNLCASFTACLFSS